MKRALVRRILGIIAKNRIRATSVVVKDPRFVAPFDHAHSAAGSKAKKDCLPHDLPPKAQSRFPNSQMQTIGAGGSPGERWKRSLDGPRPRNDAGDLKLPLIPQQVRRMLSQRAKYALKAMIRLARHNGLGRLSVTEIARSAMIPRAFLEQILSDMKRRNLLVSRRGKQGGFLLARDASKISFANRRSARARPPLRARRRIGPAPNAATSKPASCARP